MRMPPHDFQPPTGMTIHNGQPVRGDHAATVDEWAMWLASAEGGHPYLPTLLTGSIGMTASGRAGWRSNDTDWGDNPEIKIQMLVPPFCKYMQVGVVATGTGEIRISGPYQSDTVMIKVKAGSGNTVDDLVAVWCEAPGPTAADTDHPVIVSPDQGRTTPSAQKMTIRFRTSDTGHDLELWAMMFRPWPQPYGIDLTGLSAEGTHTP